VLVSSTSNTSNEFRQLNNAAINADAAAKKAAADAAQVAFNLANPCRILQGYNITNGTLYNISFDGGGSYMSFYAVPKNSTNSSFFRTCPPVTENTGWCPPSDPTYCALGLLIFAGFIGVSILTCIGCCICCCVNDCIRNCKRHREYTVERNERRLQVERSGAPKFEIVIREVE